MNFSFSNLNLSNVTAAAGAIVLPVGRHVCKVAEATIEDTKNKDGKYIKLRFREVNDKGVITGNVNVFNKSEEATRIGLEQLKGLLVAGKHPDPDNIGSHGVSSIKGLTVGVVVGTEMYQGSPRPTVKGFYDPDAVGDDAAAAASTGPKVGSEDMPF